MIFSRLNPSFYSSPRLATEVPPEKRAYMAVMKPKLQGRHDAAGVVDVDPASASYGKLVGKVEMPNASDELHHLGVAAAGFHWGVKTACDKPFRV
jgi:methanethiol oxidase